MCWYTRLCGAAELTYHADLYSATCEKFSLIWKCTFKRGEQLLVHLDSVRSGFEFYQHSHHMWSYNTSRVKLLTKMSRLSSPRVRKLMWHSMLSSCWWSTPQRPQSTEPVYITAHHLLLSAWRSHKTLYEWERCSSVIENSRASESNSNHHDHMITADTPRWIHLLSVEKRPTRCSTTITEVPSMLSSMIDQQSHYSLLLKRKNDSVERLNWSENASDFKWSWKKGVGRTRWNMTKLCCICLPKWLVQLPILHLVKDLSLLQSAQQSR